MRNCYLCHSTLVLIISGSVNAALEPPVHPLFDGDQVHEFHLTFEQDDWWEQLENNYESQVYIEASFDWGNIHMDTIGVRFKGGSSYMGNMTMKKSFKLDIDVFVDGQEIYGLDKLNLNCNFNDPSFVREICGYEICQAAGLPTERSSFVALYINDTYWGLYTLVEQCDQEFIDSRFGSGENGNLWKGDEHGSLEYLGSSPYHYYGLYELKTNEEENDWTALIDLTYGINNTPVPYLLDSLSDLMDINSALALLAVDNLVVNLDSYAGRCCNYYLYNRERDDRFVFANWDMNESWGVFNSWGLSIPELCELSIDWVSPDFGEERPMAEQLWSIDEMQEVYKGHLLRLLACAVYPGEILPRMEGLRELIASWVYMETPPQMIFTADEFDAAMTTDIQISGPGPIRYAPALQPFIEGRYMYLTSVLGTWNPVDDLVLNELMAKNDTTVRDNYGEYDDWLEITNSGTDTWNLEGFYLTDDMAYPHKFAFPDTTIEVGEHLVVWADNDPEQGSMHAEFKLNADGEDLFLLQDYIIVDFISFPEMEADEVYGRYPDAVGEWQFLQWATPGEINGEPTGIALLVSPSVLQIQSVYPNPAWTSCSVVFDMPVAGTMDVSLYDVSGKLMLTERLNSIPAGSSNLELNVTELPSGIYFVNLRSGMEMDTASLVVLR